MLVRCCGPIEITSVLSLLRWRQFAATLDFIIKTVMEFHYLIVIIWHCGGVDLCVIRVAVKICYVDDLTKDRTLRVQHIGWGLIATYTNCQCISS